MKSIAILSILFASTAFAASSNQSQPPAPPSGGPAGLETALAACQSSGKPGDSAFESCMTSKGFTKPTGSPPQGKQ